MYKVAKRYKKLVIMDDSDRIVYHPPEFLKKIKTRKDMQKVVDVFNEKGYDVSVIADLETKYNPRI